MKRCEKLEYEKKADRKVRGGKGRRTGRSDEEQNANRPRRCRENGNNRQIVWNWKMHQGVSFIGENLAITS